MKKSVSLSLPQIKGEEILQAAVARHQRDMAEAVIQQIQQLVSRIEWLKGHRATTERRIDFCNRQITALRANEFSLIENANTSRAQLVFEEAELNRSWESIT